MSEENMVGPGKVVSIDFVLTDPSGSVLDRSPEGRPLVYLHGARNIVEGLEAALEGKVAGDSVKVTVPPEKGYGPKRNFKTLKLLRSKFPETMEIAKGMRFVMEGPEGRPMPIWVTKVMGREVHVTPEHPLAGVTLAFDATVREVRDASDEERAHGHPHGPGGAHD
jgi:FKBP-type peptidyl-prolyl cis-trans isomerase SlyD